MRMKSYRTIVHYNNGNALRKILTENCIKFREQDVLDGFWGKQFDIERPRGKGAQDKIRLINRL